MIQNPDHKWMRYVNRLLDETDPHVDKNDRIKPWFSGCIFRNKDNP